MVLGVVSAMASVGGGGGGSGVVAGVVVMCRGVKWVD